MKKSDSLQAAKIPNLADLPPGFLRPTRLRFDFVPGDSDISPICGWLVLNNLDDSIMVFETSGSCLGSIERVHGWRPQPSDPSFKPQMIENLHLRRTVLYILKRGQSYWECFRSQCASALQMIATGQSAENQSLAIMLERPMAIVRARIGFEHAGLPPNEHIWSAYDSDETSPTSPAKPADHAGQDVTIPVRLGARPEHYGGLIGFWVEDADGLKNGDFHVAAGADDDGQDPQSDQTNDEIQSFLDGTTNICQASPDADTMVTMLIDPRGEIQATSDMTPATSLALPTEHFIDPLRALEVSFRSAQLLTDPDKPGMPLPEEHSHRWSWIGRPGGKKAKQQPSDPKTEPGKVGLVEGWLRLIRKDR